MNADEEVQTIKKLKVSVRGLKDENRRLKRRGILERRQIEAEEVEDKSQVGDQDDSMVVVGGGGDSDEEEDTPLMSSSLLGVMSPNNRKKIFLRLSNEPNFTLVKQQLRK